MTQNSPNIFDHEEVRVEAERLHPNNTGKRLGISERRGMVAEVLRQVDSGVFQMQSQSGSLVVKGKKMSEARMTWRC